MTACVPVDVLPTAPPDADRFPRCVCRVCGGGLQRPYVLCYCCQVSVRQLRLPLVTVVAMAEFRPGDPLHRRLRGYKDAPVSDARRRYRDQLADLATGWMHDHDRWLPRRLGSEWDVVVAVPSSVRPAGAPVESVLRRVPGLGGPLEQLLIRGDAPTGHLRSDRRGFHLAPGVDRARLATLRILVFEDSLVTGARAQSAAAALRLAGSTVVGVLAIGRAVGSSGPHGVPVGR